MSSFPIRIISLALFSISFLPFLNNGQLTRHSVQTRAKIVYHGGPILIETINVALIWYGNVSLNKKEAIANFLKSLNTDGDFNLQPQVTKWWKMVESYQAMLPGAKHDEVPKIIVNVAKQINDTSYKYGRNLTIGDFIPKIVKEHTKEAKNMLPIIITAKDVNMEGVCTKTCAHNGIVGNITLYIILGNPELECPRKCEWPFTQIDSGPKSILFLQPPNLDKAADAMVIALATTLADTVTNPLNTGFYDGPPKNSTGVGTACKAIFGSGAFPGNPGKVHIDAHTGGSFNAHGIKDKKFLLPAIWNPKTSSCWTLM
ncbi:hypothetical protein Goklo_021697 [Gossypium klotzschianum]|uniref:Protein EXORDIUM-like 6 n=1 Tax=Gossypium klotzschianum TaxID=34286 RepID=A0A7J8UW91_9ROSI|nr:hypothetical protein [Gossypium klotzschianum]